MSVCSGSFVTLLPLELSPGALESQVYSDISTEGDVP